MNFKQQQQKIALNVLRQKERKKFHSFNKNNKNKQINKNLSFVIFA